MFERNGGEVVARIEETTVAGQNALETRLSARAAAIPSSTLPSLLLVHSSPLPFPTLSFAYTLRRSLGRDHTVSSPRHHDFL